MCFCSVHFSAFAFTCVPYFTLIYGVTGLTPDEQEVLQRQLKAREEQLAPMYHQVHTNVTYRIVGFSGYLNFMNFMSIDGFVKFKPLKKITMIITSYYFHLHVLANLNCESKNVSI